MSTATDTLEPPVDEAENKTQTGAEASDVKLHEPAEGELPKSPDELRVAHYADIIDLSRQVAEAKSRLEMLKADTASAKKEYEGLDSALLRLTRRDPMQRSLLPEPGAPQASDEPLPVDDSWKRLDINQLEIPPNAINSMYEYGIMTLGDLKHFWDTGAQLHGTVKGIGEATDAKVRDAFSDYGVAHPEVFSGAGEPAGPAEPTDDADAEGENDNE